MRKELNTEVKKTPVKVTNFKIKCIDATLWSLGIVKFKPEIKQMLETVLLALAFFLPLLFYYFKSGTYYLLLIFILVIIQIALWIIAYYIINNLTFEYSKTGFYISLTFSIILGIIILWALYSGELLLLGRWSSPMHYSTNKPLFIAEFTNMLLFFSCSTFALIKLFKLKSGSSKDKVK